MPLDGRWDIDDGSNSHSAQIDVPGEWEMQGFHVNAGAPARYRRIFTLPAGWERLRTWIRFDGVSSWCSVTVNGRAVGTHEGSFVPFAFDITPAVRPGTNTLDVDVRWGTISDTLACTSQYAAHPVGGILRRVRLYALPDTHIQEFTYETSLDSGLTSALLTLRTVVTSQGGRRSAALISWSLVDERDSVVARVSRPITPAGRGRQTVNDTCLLQIAHPLAWDPEHPHLYVLRGSLTVDGTMCQTIRSRVGLRQIAIRENRLFVNGRPIKLHGVNHHDIYPLTGRSVTAELCRRDVELFREANCNYIRTSHYPPPEALLEACDELGMFVESEASLCWIAHEAAPAWTGRDYRDPALLPYLVRANVENVLAGRGHPSVIIWSLGNESKWSPLWERVNAEVKRLDPSRPTSFHDQSWGKYNNEGSRADIANYHYPGPDGPARCDRTTDRPTLFGEYMHVQTYARRENEADPGVRGDTYARALAAMVDSVYAHDGALGGAIWAGVDDLFHLSTEKICGYGTWGLIDGWRRPKPEYTAARNAYSPVVFRDLPTALPLSGRVVLHVENRFNFTNLTECAISARAGEKVVELHADVAPHSNGTIEFDASALGGQSPVLIHVRDARGFVCAEESLTAGPHPRVRTGAPVKVSLTTFPHSFKIHSGSAEFLVDRRDGSMRYILAGGDTVARDCARWMLVRHNADDGGAPGTSGNNYTQDIVPLADTPCTGFVPSSVTETREDDGSIRVDVHGVYGRVLEGNLAMRFPPAGGVQLSYDYTVLSGFTKSAGTLLRQYGLLFTLPPSMDRLSWTRKGLWTVYPPTDPGRLQGTAKAHPRRGGFIQVPRLVPSGDWKDDAIPLGTNDFRGTKEGILSASLDDGTHAVTVASDGTQSTRTWVGNGAVMLFVAGFNGPGSCPFTMGPRPEFPAGAHITGAFTLSVQ